ncbi:DUF2779 domain-containing protein, partial [Candidatus Woesearchaeota archaeon]|nr:DUF2779 domain-containing protein [Candidatus Woesearchaeota archaeon]
MILTKSNYMIGLQCPKYLWMSVYKKDELPEPDEATQHRFDQGHVLEEYAHKLFPSGILISSENFIKNIEKTKELLKNRKPLFEAGISSNSLFSRADILKPVGKDEWDVIEVKSSTKLKDEHILDLAFQKYTYKKAGLNIRNCYLMHINKEYVRKGDIEPKKLFEKEDITEQADESLKDVEQNIRDIFKILSLKKPPEFQLEDIDTCFYDNPILDEFFQSLPGGSVFELYRGGKKCIDLFGRNIFMLADIPEEYKLTGHQEIQRRCAGTGNPHIDKKEIEGFINDLDYPLHYLDFETFQMSIPPFDNTYPYQQIPFQYSLHVVDSPGSKPKHISFLAEGSKDPRKKFLSSLKEALGSKGDIIVYNQSFEQRILKSLAELFPKEKKWVESIFERMVDLLIPFRRFHYYNPKQKGSASLKDVL